MNKTKLEKQMGRVRELAPAYRTGNADISVFQELHWLMWDWIAKNPTKEKYEWLGWKYCKNGINGCFVCQYVVDYRLESGPYLNCLLCPVRKQCGDIYISWLSAHEKKKKGVARKYALLIRDCWPINHEKKEI